MTPTDRPEYESRTVWTREQILATGATLDRCHIGGRGYATVAKLGNLSTPLTYAGTYNGETVYHPDHPDVLFTFEAAARCPFEAERLFDAPVDPDAALPF